MCPTETKNEKLNAYRIMGDFCDMNIQVGVRKFRAHKAIVAAASEYFERKLIQHPDENTFILREDEVGDADLFEEVVLPFIYTDDDNEMLIDENNVVKLLRLSALLTIQSLENRCIRFIRQTYCTVPNMLNLFVSTSVKSLNKPSWIPVLSCYIMKHFHEYNNEFMILWFSFEDFKALLGARFFLSPKNEDTFLDTIIEWYHRAEEERREHFIDLIDYTNFPNISARYMKYLVRNFCLKKSSVDRPRLSAYPAYNERFHHDIKWKPISGLHMYIADDAEKIRVYSANKSITDWNVSSVKKVHSNDWIYWSLASLELDNHLYSLDYSANENIFNARSDTFSFSAENSSDVRSLKPPPVKMKRFSMCSSSRKSIYVSKYDCFWDWDTDFNIIQDVDKWAFDKEGITQGIFEYNVVVDNWFPLPRLVDEKLTGSAVTADNNILYLIDGEMEQTSVSYVNIRALDDRTSKWQTLTKNVSTCDGSAMLGYAYEGKIYVCPGCGDHKRPGVVIGVYDLKTNSWEKFQKVNHIYKVHQLLFYKNCLWTFGMSARNRLCEIEVLNPVTQEWSQSPFSNVNRVTEDGSRNVHFKNAFIFKSLLF